MKTVSNDFGDSFFGYITLPFTTQHRFLRAAHKWLKLSNFSSLRKVCRTLTVTFSSHRYSRTYLLRKNTKKKPHKKYFTKLAFLLKSLHGRHLIIKLKLEVEKKGSPSLAWCSYQFSVCWDLFRRYYKRRARAHARTHAHTQTNDGTITCLSL